MHTHAHTHAHTRTHTHTHTRTHTHTTRTHTHNTHTHMHTHTHTACVNMTTIVLKERKCGLNWIKCSTSIWTIVVYKLYINSSNRVNVKNLVWECYPNWQQHWPWLICRFTYCYNTAGTSLISQNWTTYHDPKFYICNLSWSQILHLQVN